MPSGAKKRRITTAGWDLRVEWIDGSSSWVPLSDVKESNPIEVAEYAVAHQLEKQPAFAWWVGTVLSKRARVIKQVHHRMVKKNVKALKQMVV